MEHLQLDIPNREARKWAMFCHLGGLAILTPVPFAGIVLVLVLWLARRDDHPFINEQGKEALNFQIAMAAYMIALIAILTVLTILIIGAFFWWLVGLLPILQMGLSVIAGIKANDGEHYRYPFIFRLIA